jgi:hypothetical protein
MSVKDLRHGVHLTLATIEDPEYYLTQYAEYTGFAEKTLEDTVREVKRYLHFAPNHGLAFIDIPEKPPMFDRVYQLAEATGDTELLAKFLRKIPQYQVKEIIEGIIKELKPLQRKGLSPAAFQRRHDLNRKLTSVAAFMIPGDMMWQPGQDEPRIIHLFGEQAKKNSGKELKFVYTSRLPQKHHKRVRQEGVQLAHLGKTKPETYQPFADHEGMAALKSRLEDNLTRFHEVTEPGTQLARAEVSQEDGDTGEEA